MKEPVTLNLALQGGGSHGAYTWGVIKRLLGESWIRIEGISGTSSGAVNGCLLACGLSGTAAPEVALDEFWTQLGRKFTSIFMPSDELFRFPFMGGSAKNQALEMFLSMTQSYSPYLFNPDNLNPLRDLLQQFIDFGAIRKNRDVRLFLAATNVRTSKLRIFKGEELTVEHILASACLPSVHHPVTIDNETFWDGGFTGNPSLYPLIFNCRSADLLIVLLQPHLRESIPASPEQIRERIFEIAFQSNFMREMRAIAFSKQIIGDNVDTMGVLERRLHELRIHNIHADEDLQDLDNLSRYNASPDMLQQLHDAGYRCAGRWLQNNAEALGKKGTTSLEIYSDYPL